jgi:nucleoside-diphosphate-sugar epimerase
MKLARILITGGSGFIGTRLAHRLIAAGMHVTNAGRKPSCVANVENILVPSLTIEALDAALPAAVRFDGVIHLAAAGVNPSDRDSEAIIGINAMLAPRIVSFAARRHAQAVIMVGSSAEYRASAASVPIEEDAPLETQKLYGASKAAGGILALASGALETIPTGVLRLFNVYGPGEAPHRLLPSLARGLCQREPAKLSPGTQVRDFIHVDDACAGLIAALNALGEQSMPSGAYNLSTGIECSVAEFARTAAAALNADPGLLQFGALAFRPDDLPYVVGNPGKLINACGWMPRIALEAGIRDALGPL